MRSTTLDVNLLTADSRTDHFHHRMALASLKKTVAACADGASVKLMPMVVTSFIRLVTNRKIFVQPTPIKDALAFIDALVSLPGISMPTLGTEWPIFRQLCDEGNLCANDIPDAWLAAAVIHSGDHLITFDADFKKLLKRSQLTILDPK